VLELPAVTPAFAGEVSEKSGVAVVV